MSQEILEQTIKDTLGPKRETPEDYAIIFDEEYGLLSEENSELKGKIGTLLSKIEELKREAKLSIQQGRSLQRQELGEAISILLPNIDFLNNSKNVILQEFDSYEPILRELHGLSNTPGEIKGERVENAPKWKKRNFSTGQKHDGRFYFRNDGSKWRVLVSSKKYQERDIEYLKCRSQDFI